MRKNRSPGIQTFYALIGQPADGQDFTVAVQNFSGTHLVGGVELAAVIALHKFDKFGSLKAKQLPLRLSGKEQSQRGRPQEREPTQARGGANRNV